MRQREPLSPEELRELDALERALAGDPVAADLRDFEDLVHDIRATAPEMNPGFAASLEHRVAEGFPATEEQPAPRRSRRWILLPAAGALCAALVALVVVLGSDGSGPNGGATFAGEDARAPAARPGASAGSQAGELASKPDPPRATAPKASGGAAPRPAPDAPSSSAKARPAPGASSSGATAPAQDAPGVAAAPPPGRADRREPAPAAPGETPRKVQRSADLVLQVPSDQLESTSDGVIRTVDRFGGIVANSTIASDDATGGEATFELRIPTQRLDDALEALSKLGHVTQRSQNLVDITSSFESTQDRLSDARAERRGLLKALGRARTDQQIDSLRARLRRVRSQIARLNRDLAALRRRADLSTVSVAVRGGGSPSGEGSGSGGSWTPGDAARDAVRVLEVIAGVLLIALAIVAPLGLLGLMGAFGVRITRRRRRDSALGPA